MGQLLAPRAFGSKQCVVRAFVVTPDTHSFIHSRFSLRSSEASREPKVLLKELPCLMMYFVVFAVFLVSLHGD